ncbi:pheromone-regulated protein PRM1 [Sporobolomyces koalae]|uniref:pheromone-regulated protein PRM1 n=1 Tax=Sporobolomyces koalae TaxID=500713 RepID=UPI00317374BC
MSLPILLSGSSPPTAARRLHPYLGPRARLSLSWLSQHFLALLLVLVALGFLLSAIPPLVEDGKRTLTAACSGVEGAANVAVSMPHYLADGVNEMNAKTLTAVTNGAGTVLDLTLQALEAIILFMIDTYRSLFLCLLDLLVHGSLTLLIHAIEEAQEFVTDALANIRTGVQTAISGINTGLEKSIGLVDKIPGINIDTPKIDIPELAALENVTIPSTIVQALTNLNSSIPTLDEFRVKINSLISTPIEALRQNINATLSNRSIEIEMLPVPAKQTVEICNDLDTSWIDDVGDDLSKFVKLAIGLVILLMVLFMLACAVWERYSHRNFMSGVAAAREAWLRDLVDSSAQTVNPSSAQEALSKPNLLSFLNASSHPTLFSFVSRIQKILFVRSSNAKANLIWFCSYIAHPQAWAFLTLGLVGLLVVQVQLWVLRGPVKDLTIKRANQGAGEFSASVVGTLNAKMNESSFDFAARSNRMVLSVEDGINRDLFGWVNTTTEALNTTIVGFYDGLASAITDVFDGTVLEDPILNLVYCLVGSKVDAISTALTWMHTHAHISLPTLSPTILMLSSNRSKDLTDSLTSPNSAVSTTSIVSRMLRAYERSLEQQRLGFCIAIGIWALVVLMGLAGLGWRSGGEQAWDKWRGTPVTEIPREKETNEKTTYFKPLHLRSRSTVSGRQLPPPRSPRDELTVQHLASYSFGSSATHTTNKNAQPSAASWASLVDFFKPTLTSDDNDKAQAEPETTVKKTLTLPTISLTVPRALRANPGSHFKPRPFISRPRPSPAQRRDSDLVDLRTGEYVSRSIPKGNGFSQRLRGVGDDIVNQFKGSSSPRSSASIAQERRIASEAERSQVKSMRDRPHTVIDNSERFSALPYMSARSSLPANDENPFADPTRSVHRKQALQPPLSPDPKPSRNPSSFDTRITTSVDPRTNPFADPSVAHGSYMGFTAKPLDGH